MRNPEIAYFNSIKKFVISFIACLSFLWLLISLIDWCFSYKLLGNSKLNGFFYLLFFSILFGMGNIIIGLILELNKSKRVVLDSCDELKAKSNEDIQVVPTLFSDLNSSFEKEKWEEVIKIGSVLSRPLWVTGKYNLRINIGKLVEEASAYSNNQEKQASTLIDDLGWTYVALKDYDQAKKNIMHGLEIAKTINNPVIACKAYRHLSGICLRENKIELAKEYSKQSQGYLEVIQDIKIKKEMKAGLLYLEAVIYKAGKNFNESISKLEKAAELYENEKDNDRYSKCLTLKGNILFEMGEYNISKDIFRKSLALSKKISREDQVIENYLGLGKIFQNENDFAQASQCFQLAYDSAESIGNKKLAHEINSKYIKKGE